MKKIFFTPGPSQLYPTIGEYIKQGCKQNIFSISHRSDLFKKIYKQVMDNLRRLLTIPENYHIVFVSSGTEAMEVAIQNTVERNSFHFINGSFGNRFEEIAKQLGKQTTKQEALFGKSFEQIPQIPNDTELICLTQNETSSGVAIDPRFIYQIREKYPKMLIAVDTVSSMPYVDLDYQKVDIVFFSVQKLFGLPAGLGVIIVNPRALEKSNALAKNGNVVGSYHSFQNLVKWSKKYQKIETPNVLDIYLLYCVTSDFLKKGVMAIRQETDQKADIAYHFFEKHPQYKPFVTNRNDRSSTVAVINTGRDTRKIINTLAKKGFVVGEWYGPYKDTQIRIALFPAVTVENLKHLLKEFYV